MRRTVLRVLFLWVTAVWLVGGVNFGGHLQPAPEGIATLNLSFCRLPCWNWIIPGQTTLVQASQRILDKYSDQSIYDVEIGSPSYPSFTITHKISGRRIRVDVNQIAEQPASAIVDEIILWFNVKSGSDVKFGDLYAELGVPSDIILSAPDDDPYPVVRYDDQHTTVALSAVVLPKDCAILSPDTMVLGMIIYSPNVYHQLPVNYAWVSNPIGWSGFQSCYTFTQD